MFGNPKLRLALGATLAAATVMAAAMKFVPRMAHGQESDNPHIRQEIPLPQDWDKGFVVSVANNADKITGMYIANSPTSSGWHHWAWTSPSGFEPGQSVPTQGFWQKDWSSPETQKRVKDWNEKHGWVHSKIINPRVLAEIARNGMANTSEDDYATFPPHPLLGHMALSCQCRTISSDSRSAIGIYEVDGGPRRPNDTRGIAVVNHRTLTVDKRVFLWTRALGFVDLLKAVPALAKYKDVMAAGVLSEDGKFFVGNSETPALWVVPLPNSVGGAGPAANKLVLTGTVVSANPHQMDMLVRTVRSAGGKTVTLPKARRKVVLIPKSVALGAQPKPGATVVVTGTDSGPGSPLKASSIGTK